MRNLNILGLSLVITVGVASYSRAQAVDPYNAVIDALVQSEGGDIPIDSPLPPPPPDICQRDCQGEYDECVQGAWATYRAEMDECRMLGNGHIQRGCIRRRTRKGIITIHYAKLLGNLNACTRERDLCEQAKCEAGCEEGGSN
jgi:hypothetical protein